MGIMSKKISLIIVSYLFLAGLSIGRSINISDQYNDFSVLPFQTQLLEDPNGNLSFDEVLTSEEF